MANCIFCQIIEGKIPAQIIYDDNDILAFKDIQPQAPLHYLIIPKKHISTLNDITVDDASLIGKMYLVAKELIKKEGVNGEGFRTVINCGEDAGQTVFHLHLHLLAGRKFNWPAG